MAHVCPWWGGYFIDNAVRRLVHNPQRLLSPYVRQGMTVLDIGCGMGMFSIAMAEMVGREGRVIAVDLQPQMLRVLTRRAQKAGLADRIRTHQCEPNRLGVGEMVDFSLAFAMVHEVPDQRHLLQEVRDRLRPDGKFFIAEPRGHVPASAFAQTVAIAEEMGLHCVEEPRVRWCHAAVFERPL